MNKCSVCLEHKSITQFKININCGHICLCHECYDRMNNQINSNNQQKVCPICRSYGEYINIFMPDVDTNNDDLESDNDYLNQLINYSLSNNHKIKTENQGFSLYFKDHNISKFNFVMAFFGTEYSLIDGKPKLVDVTKRIKTALYLNRSFIKIQKEHLTHNIELQQNNNDNYSLFIVCKKTN